jgi:hypothetical protein
MELPGWNSIEATGALSNVFFFLSIGALVLLGTAEVAQHYYGQRHDGLLARKHQAEKDASDGEIARLNKHTAEANKAAAEANARAEEAKLALEKLKTPRHLLPEQREKLVAALAPIPRFHLVIKAGTTGGDERAYSEEIAAAMIGWNVRVDNALHMGRDTHGMWIKMKGTVGTAVPAPVVAFRNALLVAGLDIRHGDDAVQNDDAIPVGEVWLCIGAKRAD